jgi:peptidoglycan/xylan/chitin deacetylase (PgdA/CDA1 family)
MTRAWKRIGAAIVCALLARTASAASGSTVVVFTVDVESNEFRLPDQIDAVCSDGSACGLMEIARLLKERRWSGTFFLNVFEHRQWGETAMRDIAVRLQAAGQDVALHTHPQWGYDPSRWGMNQYSLDEQTTIVRDGMRLLRAWTDRPVVAHRTGAYAADERTLIALERNGLLVDSSVFWKYPTSRLDGLGLPRNLPARHGRLTEIPVTVYERETRPRIFGGAFSPVTTVRKIDPNWFTDADEARSAIDAAVASDLPTLVVFLHSFSFMGQQTAGRPPAADRHSMDMFRVILDHLGSKNLQVMTMRELAYAEVPPLASADSDIVPRVTVPVDLHRYVWRRAKASVGLSLSTGIGMTLLAAGAVLVLTRRRKATKRRARELGAGDVSPGPSGVRAR